MQLLVEECLQYKSNKLLPEFLKCCCEDDDDELSEDFADYCLGSPNLITKFIEYIGNNWGLR